MCEDIDKDSGQEKDKMKGSDFFVGSKPSSPSGLFSPTPEITPSKLTDRPSTVFAYNTPQSARETLPQNIVLSKEQVDQDNVTCLDAYGGLNTEIVGNTECAEDDSERGLTDTKCVAEERGCSAEEICMQVNGVKSRLNRTCCKGKIETNIFKTRYLIPEMTVWACIFKVKTLLT